MSTIKVNTIDNEGGAVDFPNKLTVRGNAIERTYTSSGTEPSSPSEGDFWYDTGNSLLKHYINSEFKTISFVPPATWYGSRGLNVGGMSSNAIDYFDITSSGNASDFGNLTSSRRGMGAVSNATYGVFAGGYTSTNVNTIDYITVATTGDAADFGDMTAVTRDQMSVSNGNRACFGGGSTSGDANKIEYITLGVTSGNASDFGDLTVARNGNEGGMNDATRGVFGSGYTINVLDYITIGTLGNATDFGDHTGLSYAASTSDLTKGVTAGGSDSAVRNYISYITIQTTGNATDFGDLTVARSQLAATSDATYGVFSGGFDFNNAVNTIDRISIATTGNATDHGDLNKSGNALRFCGSTSGNAS
tara:strand:- start:108 stop:1193 length:1086 start_codon:yes stop_codon:yes gene_type:complete